MFKASRHAQTAAAAVQATRPAAARRGRRQRGFTLLEQAMVVATVGVVSAVALPRLADLRSDAEGVALVAVAGAVGTAMVLNHGACAVSHTHSTADRCITVRDCSQADALLATPLPEGYQLLPQALGDAPGSGVPAQAECQIVHTASGSRASFRGFAAGG